MHLLNLIQCTELGGMEQSSLRIMAGLQDRGHSWAVVSTNPIGRLGPLLEKHGIPAEGVPFRGLAGWRTHLRLRAAVRRHPADAVLMTGPTLTGMLCLSKSDRARHVLNVQYHHGGRNTRGRGRRYTRSPFPGSAPSHSSPTSSGPRRKPCAPVSRGSPTRSATL